MIITCYQGNLHGGSCALEKLDCDLVLAAVGPVGLADVEFRLSEAVAQVGWCVYLDSVFLGMHAVLRV